MVDKNYIQQLVDTFLEDTNLFCVHISITPDNTISVFIDGDQGVTIDDCIKISKHIENHFDREVEDFSLNVSSSGLENPFVNLRQYRKNIGKHIEIQLINGEKITGLLTFADADVIEIILPKTKKNKTETVQRIDFKNIRQSRCIIAFK
ncbi:MAG: ribosome assembly cofactor RimP [Lentimicrobiaceae bacterium]|nr:ribosome assembly cofactor RimP [Lentimicrobiaceae bacterium]